MAVYTHVSEAEISAFLSYFDLGPLISFEGIAQGVENTNYLIVTGGGRFILTLFEKRVREEDIPFYLSAMAHFARDGAPTPEPQKMARGKHKGESLGRLADRPAIIISFLPGRAQMMPAPQHCAAMGRTLAHLHQTADGFPRQNDNALSLEGWRTLAAQCHPRADECAPGLQKLIDEELDWLAKNWPAEDSLTKGLIHADLFPDNVFFDDPASGTLTVSGIIDFYFSCTDYLAYDLAITLNAWCSNASNEVSKDGAWLSLNAAAMLEAYQATRALNEHERTALPVFCGAARCGFCSPASMTGFTRWTALLSPSKTL